MTSAQIPLKQRIRQARRDAGLTQKMLADRLDVTDRAIQAWESGETEPRLTIRPLLAAATGKPLAFFRDEVAA